MTHTYGALRPDYDKPYDFFGITIEVLEKRDFEIPGRKTWPYHPVIFKRSDTNEVVSEIGIPTPSNMVLDESNVFDILEFLAHCIGKHDPQSSSPYDITLTFPYTLRGDRKFHDTKITMKRAVGCRHFVFKAFQQPAVHITSHGKSEINELPRHELPSLFFVKSDFTEVKSWTAGTDTEGLKITFYGPVREGSPATVYSIPFTFTPTPKEISRIQITGAKKYVEDPNVFANHPGSYDPKRLVKQVVNDRFWYLRSLDGKLIITLTKDPHLTAIAAVFDEFKKQSSASRNRMLLIWTEWMARDFTSYTEAERKKAIILNAIQMLENLKNTVDDE